MKATNPINDLITTKGIHLVSYGIGGSRAYGMHTDASDFDYGGIYIRDPRESFSNPYMEYKAQFTFKEDLHEGTVYEFNKAFDLIADCNPNMLELIWRDQSDVIYSNEIQDILVEHRELLLTKKAKHTFSGYAHSQFQRIKNHQKMVNSPYKNPPGFKMDDMNYREYREHITQHEKYKEWYERRNPKRRILEDKFGYDTKYASHLIRLLRMGVEILKDEGVLVKRPDAEELIDIRNGKYTYKELEEEFMFLTALINNIEPISKLRKKVDPKDVVKIRTKIWDCYYEKLGRTDG